MWVVLIRLNIWDYGYVFGYIRNKKILRCFFKINVKMNLILIFIIKNIMILVRILVYFER